MSSDDEDIVDWSELEHDSSSEDSEADWEDLNVRDDEDEEDELDDEDLDLRDFLIFLAVISIWTC